MKEFDCPDIGITITRQALHAFVLAFGAYKSRGEQVVMRHFGLKEIPDDPASRFPLTKFLSAMDELQAQFGAPFMRKVGSFLFDNTEFPPGMDTLQKAMALMDVAYYMNHSAEAEGKIGGYHWKAEGDRRGVMTLDNPYPCAFDMGVIETIGRRFEPTAKVEHVPGSCRHEGGNECVLTLAW